MKPTDLSYRAQKMACFFLFSILLIFIGTSYASDRYFLCGPDEDGCSKDMYPYCTCIPYNDLEASNPYCFDFDAFTCVPLSQSPDCYPEFIHKDQGSCLATIFQSSPVIPCKITTHEFCLSHKMPVCNPDGQPDSCH